MRTTTERLGRLYLLTGARPDSDRFGPVNGSFLDVVGELLAPHPDGRPVALVGRLLDRPRSRSDRVVWKTLPSGGDADLSFHDEAIAVITGRPSTATPLVR